MAPPPHCARRSAAARGPSGAHVPVPPCVWVELGLSPVWGKGESRNSERTDDNNQRRSREIPTRGPSCRRHQPLPTTAAASPVNQRAHPRASTSPFRSCTVVRAPSFFLTSQDVGTQHRERQENRKLHSCGHCTQGSLYFCSVVSPGGWASEPLVFGFEPLARHVWAVAFLPRGAVEPSIFAVGRV